MSSGKRLRPEEREFFALIAELIFSNPFSTARDEVVRALGLAPQQRPSPGEHAFDAIDPVLEERLHALEQRGIRRIQQVSGRDAELLRYAYLFSIYHDFVDYFDRLIEVQSTRGEDPAPVPFAGEMIARLEGCGFPGGDIPRYLALFYQFRRAFHFIGRALIGEAPCMKQLRHALWNNVFTRDVRIYGDLLWNRMEDFSTLLLGETGTGKGSAAAAIGRSGPIPFDPATGRFSHSFTAVLQAINLSQFPESLIESELFGHRKGAFTGAIDHHKGVFERCSEHGALFLDEIGDVSVPVQIKLLNVLQERNFTPVGSHQARRFRGRVIAATNRPLEQLLAGGEFRHDFFYRLSSDVIEAPPLRQRLAEQPDELKRLTASLIRRLLGDESRPLVDQVLAALKSGLPRHYPWPGNVRELEQAVRRILLSGEYHGLRIEAVDQEGWLQQAAAGDLDAQQLLHHYCLSLYQRLGSYEEVARRTGLDRRTAKKYITLQTDAKS